ncbi:MAG: gluconate 2-dehydrogenase subunit 3 family protein [Chloroflexota bacterium]
MALRQHAPDEEAWRLGLRGIDEVARQRFSHSFVDLAPDDQNTVLHAIAQGDPPGAVWRRLPAPRFWIYIASRVKAAATIIAPGCDVSRPHGSATWRASL